MRRYKVLMPMMSLGVPIKTSMKGDRSRPMTVRMMPPASARKYDVWTEADIASFSFLPICLAMTILEPVARPLNKDTIRLTREPVAPTAARAACPENFPTMIVSAALKAICSRLEIIRGYANSSILRTMGPCVMLIVLFDITDIVPIIEKNE